MNERVGGEISVVDSFKEKSGGERDSNPRRPFGSVVFKTTAFDHSAIPAGRWEGIVETVGWQAQMWIIWQFGLAIGLE